MPAGMSQNVDAGLGAAFPSLGSPQQLAIRGGDLEASGSTKSAGRRGLYDRLQIGRFQKGFR